MMASLASFSEFLEPMPRGKLTRLYAEALVLEADARRLRETVREVIASPETMLTPFGPALGIAEALAQAEEIQQYDHDEDMWSGDDGGA